MDLSKLSTEQLEIAKKVAAEAERQGVNPGFVLSMAMAESSFDPKALSPKGAIGVMQLMPDTAKGLKVDPNNIDENIAGGIKLIKQLVSNRNIGNDPQKVLMGYNAGPGTKFFTTGNIEDLPTETLNHIVKVSNNFGGQLPPVLSVQPERESGAAPEAVAASPGAEVRPTDDGQRLEAQGTSDIPGAIADNKPFLGIVGGVTGLGTAASLETTKKVAPLLPNIMNAMMPGREVNPNLPQSRLSLQRYLNSQIAPNLRLPLRDLEREITALQRVTTPNAPGTKIRTMSEVQMALDAIKEVEAKTVTKPMVRQVPGRPGVFENTGMFTSSTTPGRPGVDLSAYETRGNPGPLRQAVQRELTTAGEVGRAVAPSVARVVTGGLGGAGALMSGYDAYELKKKIDEDKRRGINQETTLGMTPDEWRLLSKSSATLGGGLSMLPFGVTQIGGLALSAPEIGMSIYDWLKNRDNTSAQSPAPAPASPLNDGRVVPQ
jgi:hypothetical protein